MTPAHWLGVQEAAGGLEDAAPQGMPTSMECLPPGGHKLCRSSLGLSQQTCCGHEAEGLFSGRPWLNFPSCCTGYRSLRLGEEPLQMCPFTTLP